MTTVLRPAVFAALCVGLVAYAADPPAGDLKGRQSQNAEQFRLLKDQLLKLSQKLAVSDKPAERERAKVIQAAIELAARENVDGQFRALAGELGKDAATVQDLERAIGQDGQLLKALQDMLALLLTDDEAMRTRAEIKRLEEHRKEARDILRAQETARALTDAQKADAAKLAEAQARIAERTKALERSMAGDKKAGDKKSAGDPKGDNKSGEPKGDKKSGEGKDGEPKAKKTGDDPKGGKNGGPKSDKSDGEKSGGDPKNKDGEPKDGEPKGGRTPKGSRSGKNQPGQPQDGSPKGGQEQDQQNQPPGPPTPGRQRIQQAIPHQEGASDDLKEQKRPDAGQKQDQAIKQLEQAVKELEKRLRQLREEEAMRQLAGLEARCNRMIQLQSKVNEATAAIDAAVRKAGGQKGTADIQKAQAEADREREVVAEADKTLDLLKAEGSAVAFAGVLAEVREDMAGVQQRLTGADVGAATQEIEANILALLKEMAAALKKQQQDMQDQQQQDQQQPPSGPQPNQALVNKIAQLKLIRSLQSQVNSRTKLFGGKSPGEQADDPQQAADLRTLAARQAKIQEMIAALATGANQ